MSPSIPRSALPSPANSNTRSPLLRWDLVLGLELAYLFVYPPLERLWGPSASTLLVIPVAAAAWHFGLFGGLISTILNTAFNIGFLVLIEGYNLDGLIYIGLPFRLTVLIAIVFGIHIYHRQIDRFVEAAAQARKREKYLTLLTDMTRSILLAKDIDSTLKKLAFDMTRLLDADDCYITRWDQEKQITIPTVTTADLGFSYASDFEPVATELTMTESVLQARRVLTAEDVFNSPYISPEIAKRYPAASILGVPLIAGDNKLGAAMIAFNTPHKFTQDEINRAEQAGNQIALALWNFQQSFEIQRRLEESHALTAIGRSLSEQEHTGIDKVLQLIVDAARELIPLAEESVIHLVDEKEQILVARAVSGYDRQHRHPSNIHMHTGEGIAGQVIREGRIINIGDVAADARFIQVNESPRYQSLLVAPVQKGGEQLGTISVQSQTPNAFARKDEHLLTSLGVQAAIAIENTRLFEATQQRLREVNALYAISRELAASLDTDTLLGDVVRLLQKNFGYYHVQIYLLDSTNGDLVLKRGSGEVGRRLLEEGYRLKRGTGIVGHVAETGDPFVTNNVNEIVFFFRNPLLPHTQSELSVPIRIEGMITGVLDIQHSVPNRLTEADLQLMTAVADQVAVALQKARLYNDLQTALQHEQAFRLQLIQSERLALTGKLLASVSHELNNPLQAIQNTLFLLKDETGVSDQGRQDLEILLAETDRMKTLIERLRSIYRPVQTEEFQPVQFNELITDVRSLIAAKLRHGRITMQTDLDPRLPIIHGIFDQLRQVVLNLVLNAAEATPAGGSLTIQTRSTDGGITCRVKDTGRGIDPDLLPRIFEAFVTDKTTGTGLGLAIAHDIIERHGGQIHAENLEGGGAMFSLWLPVQPGETI